MVAEGQLSLKFISLAAKWAWLMYFCYKALNSPFKWTHQETFFTSAASFLTLTFIKAWNWSVQICLSRQICVLVELSQSVCESEWLVDISGHRRAARSIWIPNCNCMNGAVPCNQGVTQEKGNRSENYHMKSARFLSLGWPAGKECFKMPLSSH